MKKFSLSWITLGILISFVLYCLYLAFNSSMHISCDAIGYESLGKLLQEKGLVAYIKSGPQREPVYPATIAFSMAIASIIGCSYLKIQTVLQILIVFLSMAMLFVILRKIGVQRKIATFCILYFGLSPAIMNSALSLFSEIMTYPLVLGIIWVSLNIYETLEKTKIFLAFVYGVFLGLLLGGMTLSKGTFELVTPVFLFVLMILSWVNLRKKAGVWRNSYVFVFLISFLLWGGIVREYKLLNQKYNGNFILTDRGPWHFYGNVVKRTEPLTQARLKAALASVPGDGVCHAVSTEADCFFWNFQQTDAYGWEAFNNYTNQGNNIASTNKKLLADGIQGIGKNPVQYVFLTAVEAVRMFFWESTQVGFVTYPRWLSTIYENVLVKNGLRLLISLLTIVAFFWVCFQCKHLPIGMMIMLSLASIFIIIHSFGSVLTRYAFPIVPLYVCLIAFWLDKMFFVKK